MYNTRNPFVLVRSAGCSVATLLFCVTFVHAQPLSQIEREMSFVDGLADATELYNDQRYEQALEMFQSLAREYADLDTEGYATLGLGDCLARLGRLDEARAVYESAVAARPQLQEAVQSRLQELTLAGPITDTVLDELRAAVQQQAGARFASAWRLGRALQKQAADRLAEAARVFRAAAQLAGEKPCPPQQLINQAVYLEELLSDLRFLMEEIEDRLTMPRNLDLDPDASMVAVQEWFDRQVLQLPGGAAMRVEVEQRSDAGMIVSIDGRAVNLSAAERRLLQRHRDRMNAIILKAAGQASAEPPGVK